MKKCILILLPLLLLAACSSTEDKKTPTTMIDPAVLTNQEIKSHDFLDCMYDDPYFPNFLVDKCKNILLELCRDIEAKEPTNLPELYALTQAATERINELQEEFFENDSEIETGARECLATDFEFIADAYGFEADLEEMIETREW